jgi:excisionase family DNA binding protein
VKTYLTLTEAAERLNVERRRFARWCREGLIPGAIQTPGGHWRIPSDVDAQMRRQQHEEEKTP